MVVLSLQHMKLDRDFVRFEGGPTEPTSERIHVTLNYKGRFLLNKNLYRRLGSPAAVWLYFNRKADTIAIEPTSPRLPKAFPVREKPGYFVINASPFCRHNGIKLTTTEKFITADIQNGILMLKLRETVTVSGARRPRKKKPALTQK